MSIRRLGVVLGGLPEVDSALSTSSVNPIQNQAVASAIGATNGIAGLDANGKVPPAQLPSMDYVPTSRTVNSKALSADISLDSSDVGAVPSTQKGVANGVATLDANATVPLAQLPSNVKPDAHGNYCVSGNYQHEIHTIPSATTEYTLSEGVQSHVPEAASVYVVPTITDATCTHHITLNVYFRGYARSSDDDSGSAYAWKDGTDLLYTDTATPTATETVVYSDAALTTNIGTVALYESNMIALAASASFEDAAGNDIVPKSTPTIHPGTVVQYLCEWEPCTGQWVIMPIPMVDGGAA